jgi:hypothetical protein
MLDMWISTSGNDDVQLGKGDNATYAGYEVDMNGDGTIAASEKGLTWANSYDKIIDRSRPRPMKPSASALCTKLRLNS